MGTERDQLTKQQLIGAERPPVDQAILVALFLIFVIILIATSWWWNWSIEKRKLPILLLIVTIVSTCILLWPRCWFSDLNCDL
jgi:Ca2+/Na+ antiporter